MEKLKEYISQFVAPNLHQWNDFFSLVQKESYKKGDLLLKTNEICDRIWFIDKGIARHFFINNHVEATVWFSFEGDLLTDMQSFILKTNATHSLIAVTDLDVFMMKKNDLDKLYASDIIWEKFGRMSNEEYIIKLIERSYNLLFKTGKEKYDAFISKSPEILQNIPLHQIADFIGVSFETLSRIRGKRN